jgi:AAA+ superfamily predicted ATPase
MENSIQNIVLQEIEELDGILIATTNLTSNLDNAFERRFLYKVEFHKPNADVKSKLWESLLKDLTKEQTTQLASLYDFSGGQIENIARKYTVDYILNGQKPSMEDIDKYCQMEMLNQSTRKKLGFKTNPC